MTRLAAHAPLIALLLALSLAAPPVAAQDGAPLDGTGGANDPGDLDEGLDLLGEGMRKLFKGLGDEIQPRMRDFAEAAEPVLSRLMDLIDDLDAYQMPERLPNGDIIIRRKPDAPPLADPDHADDIEI
ncbi:hypothetical protein BV509_13555 [Rhodovulum sulfidophilum]|uniref:AAA+ family ATPase n=1 Tax=Rhodovulum visakhapatnamense TaxID=364297 RepID=A0ABS1RFM0_9RHOB|nr:hypothetical protein [Rhodovulum visakhapatnamense]MBL3569587.1 AAA+ family ATPase [Rhodovulum visakhapatnamense]MBL3578440.1 AAA+ family ATPase [Rhodovulum visakhapatnamense]OLS45266.1 hypothetical protein BV509_13555 [Rhodovulum sulfidophilum]